MGFTLHSTSQGSKKSYDSAVVSSQHHNSCYTVHNIQSKYYKFIRLNLYTKFVSLQSAKLQMLDGFYRASRSPSTRTPSPGYAKLARVDIGGHVELGVPALGLRGQLAKKQLTRP